jgi:HK97 family phage major capsid protein
VNVNIQQQIASYQEARKQKSQVMADLAKKSDETGESFDAEQQKSFDEAANEVETIDKHIGRLKKLESVQAANATAVTVDTANTSQRTAEEVVKAASEERGGHGRVIAVERKLEPGIGFARFVKFMAMAQGNARDAYEMAKQVYPNEAPLHNVLKMHIGQGRSTDFIKTAVAGAIPTTAAFAGALIQYQDLAGDFVNYLRPKTILGRLPGLRNVPFKIRVKRQTGGSVASWVGAGKAKPLSNAAFDTVTLDFTKLAALSVITDEVARLSTPSAEMLVRDDLAAAVIQTMDSDFIDPANSGSSNVKPASITNGTANAVATGTTTQAGIATDVQGLFAPLITANIDTTECAWIMSPTTALGLSLLQNSLGQQVFPGVTINGGVFQGLPVIVSQAAGLVGASDGSHIVVLVHTPSILVADDGTVAVDVSREASIEMSDAPGNQSANGTGASMVSMFQTNSLAVRAERWVNWVSSRSAAVSYLTAVHWGGFPV